MFSFETIGYSCDILQTALVRYKQIITVHLRKVRGRLYRNSDGKWRSVSEYNGHLDTLRVDLKRPCEKMPFLGMDESCEATLCKSYENRMIKVVFLDEMKISEESAVLEAQSIWGVLRGLESFSQLLYTSPDGRSVNIQKIPI